MAQKVKRLPTMWETRFQSLGREDPLEKEMATHSSTLAWKSHGHRILVGYSPWGHKKSDTTKRLHFHFFFFFTLQKSIVVYILSIVIENIPKDRFPNVQQLTYGYNYRFPVKQGHSTYNLLLLPPTILLQRQEIIKEGIKQAHKDKKTKEIITTKFLKLKYRQKTVN